MSKKYALEATKRDRAGKGVARALRREGKTPAVIYGDKKPPVTIALDTNTINVEYNRGHIYTTLCDMNIEGDNHLVLARDVQLHPVTDVVEHVDFLRVTGKTKIAVNIPVHFINEDKSPGLKDGAIMNVIRYEIEMMCSATNIPDYIEVDMEGKEMGDSVTISEVTLPEGSKLVIDDRDFTIVSLQEPISAEQLEAELAADVGEEDFGEEDEEGAEGEEGEAAEGEEGGDDAASEDGEDKGE